MTSLLDAIEKAGLGETLKLTRDGDLRSTLKRPSPKPTPSEPQPQYQSAAPAQPEVAAAPAAVAAPAPPEVKIPREVSGPLTLPVAADASGRRNVLVIGVDPLTYGKVEPLLERSTFEVDRFPRGRASLELVSAVSFAVLLVRYPLPDMELAEFLDEIRRPDSRCLRTPVVLLTENGEASIAQNFIGKGANRVLSIADTADQLQGAVSELLEVAPRLGIRVIASLQVRLEEGTSLAMCQTENVSVSGMLVRTNVGYPVGTRLSFEFALPEDALPVRGEAEVVRHTTLGREMVRGVGCRFLEFERDGRRRFETYLNRRKNEI